MKKINVQNLTFLKSSYPLLAYVSNKEALLYHEMEELGAFRHTHQAKGQDIEKTPIIVIFNGVQVAYINNINAINSIVC